MFSQRFIRLLQRAFAPTFARQSTRRRAALHAVALLCCLGTRTISRVICAKAEQDKDWSAEYKLFSRSPWKVETLFRPVLEEFLARFPEKNTPIVVALDDTKLHKTGKTIPGASYQRDPLSPPFHQNLILALRFLQASLIFPHYREGDFGARALPVRFDHAPHVKKPGKKAEPETLAAWRKAKKSQNLPLSALAQLRSLRADFDKLGAKDRPLLAALDGSFCNKAVFSADLERVELVARCRKDAKLCLRAQQKEGERGRRRVYAQQTFTPEAIRKDERVPWSVARVHYGGDWREVRYKECEEVLWRGGSKTRPLRLLILAPQPYKKSPRSRANYRSPAYFLSTNRDWPAATLLQAALDRWQIEQNHRDEKTSLGVGEAQVWSKQSVPRQPSFAVACYSLLLLASLLEHGPGRSQAFPHLPAWRKNAKRPSVLDLVTLLRQEMDKMGEDAGAATAQDQPKTASVGRVPMDRLVASAYT